MHRRLLKTSGITAGIVAALLTAGCGTGTSPSSGPEEAAADNEAANVGFHGVEKPMSIEERLETAELVVVGTVTRIETRRFKQAISAEELSESDRGDPIYQQGSFREAIVRVDEHLSGSRQDTLSVRWLAEELHSPGGVGVSGAEDPSIEAGSRYLLALFEGTGVWQGGHLILGSDGRATIADGTARFPSGAERDLAEIRALLDSDS